MEGAEDVVVEESRGRAASRRDVAPEQDRAGGGQKEQQREPVIFSTPWRAFPHRGKFPPFFHTVENFLRRENPDHLAEGEEHGGGEKKQEDGGGGAPGEFAGGTAIPGVVGVGFLPRLHEQVEQLRAAPGGVGGELAGEGEFAGWRMGVVRMS